MGSLPLIVGAVEKLLPAVNEARMSGATLAGWFRVSISKGLVSFKLLEVDKVKLLLNYNLGY